MPHVISSDGTRIAYDRQGSGPAVVLVGGGLTDREENAPLAAALAARGFTVSNYDRRGRGRSGDTPPYAVEREIEDLAALVAEAGGRAHLFGASSGGGLALLAAAAGPAVERIAVWEVPYLLGAEARRAWLAYREDLEEALRHDRRDEALTLFMRLAGSPETQIAEARRSPHWPPLRGLAPTLAHDAAVLGDGAPPAERLARVTQPVLVATGREDAFFAAAAEALAAALPNARRLVLPGHGHVAEPEGLAAALADFLVP